MTESDRDRWYVASTLPGREEVADLHLVRQGFRPFLPRIMKTVRHARKLITRRAAFFPGYLFVEIDVTRERWRSVNGTMGIRNLIMDAEAPVPVPRGLVEEFLALSDPSGILCFEPELKVGDEVRVASGPFADVVARLERLDSGGRARVLLGLLSGEVAATMDVRDLVPVRLRAAGGL